MAGNGRRVGITSKVTAALPWALGEGLLSFAFSFATTIVMARLLAPEEFGSATIAIAVSAIVQSILIVGPTSAFVRTESVDSLTSDSMFWGLLGLGVLGTVLCAAVAIPLSRLYEVPRLQGLIAVQGLSCVVLAVSGVPTALLTRKLRTRALTLRTLGSKFFTLIVTTALAGLGFGSWSVIWGGLAGAIAAAIFLWAKHPRAPRARMALSSIKGVFRIGWQIGIESLLGLLTIRGSLLLFGHFHGLKSLGHVNFGMRLVDEFAGVLNVMAQRTSLAYFAALKRTGADTGKAFLQGTRAVSILIAPIFVGLAAVSSTLIPLFFGSKWASSALAAQVIAVVWLLRFVRVLAPAVLRSHGVQGPLVVNAFFGMILSLSYVTLTGNLDENFGLLAFLLPACVSLPAGVHVIRRIIGVSIKSQFVAILPSLAAASVMGAGTLWLGSLGAALPRAILLACQILFGIVSYLMVLVILDRSAPREIAGLRSYVGLNRK